MRLLAFHGRATRKEYFLHWLGGVVGYVGFIVLAVLVTSNPEAPQWVGNSLGILFLLVMVIILVDDIGVTLRRLEDLGRPRTHFWMLLIPIYNIYLTLLLFFEQGTQHAPKGLAPRREVPAQEDDSSSEYMCSRCGKEIKWGDTYCSGCGDTIEY